MATIRLNGKKMYTIEKTHIYLAKKFTLPDYYGANLDALWDCLTDINKNTDIVFENFEDAKKNIGTYADDLVQLFEDLQEETSFFTFKIN